MALTSWKSMRFFDVSEPQLLKADLALFSQRELRCLCTGPQALFVADYDGNVRILSEAFKIIRSFKAYEDMPITHMRQIENTSYLVTIAEDLSNEPLVKVWAIDNIDKNTNSPRCLSTISIHNGRRQFPVTSFTSLNDLSQLAFGFANGSVTIVRGDLIHDRGAKQRIVFESEEPITGVEFRDGNTTALYIATTTKILNLIVSGKGQGQPARTIDDQGCAFGCMAIDKQSRDVVVARDDAIYYYGLHGRGSRFNCDGQKSATIVFRDYVALGYSTSGNTISKASNFALNSVAFNSNDQGSTFTILNTDFHIIAHTANLSSEIRHVFEVWGDLFVLTIDGKLTRYHEKTLQQRLEVLYQRNFYVLAIQMVQKAGADKSLQNTVFRKYGDHLYQNRDYDTAMQQYLRAIDQTEPSQVIRKFLGTQRIQNLIDYLEELHEHRKANTDHTTLLLNCYAKLKDVGKLENFIKTTSDANFDVDTAISMCRQGGYYEQAAYLARKHSDHELVISILIEDLKKYAEALAYIWRLDPLDAYRSLIRYATVLLEHCPEDATSILIEYYTGKFQPKQDAVVVTSQTTPAKSTSFASSAVQNLAALIPLPYMNVSSSEQPDLGAEKTETHIVEALTNHDAPPYEAPRPRTAFSAFVDHPNAFVNFLEACIESPSIAEENKIDLYTTLFEMYLRKANQHSNEERDKWLQKARRLTENKHVPIDSSNVFLLSELETFRDGSTMIREQQGLCFDIFRSYTTAKDTQGAIKALHKYGYLEPQLYPAALSYFTSDTTILNEAGPEFDAVLKKIEEDRLMAPMQVIQTLSSNAVATMGLVKRYLRDSIGREREEISDNRRTTQAFRQDTSRKLSEFEMLKSKPISFTAQRCHACGSVLDQPIVHFMCKHSFHKRCLNLNDGEGVENIECPTCATQNATVKAIKRAQDESKEKHEVFQVALGRSKDGFGTIAEWFGRGVMGVSSNE